MSGTNIAVHKASLRLIQGGKSMSEDATRAHIRAVLKEVDERNTDLAAGVILAIVKRELSERRLILALASIASAAVTALAIIFYLHR